MDSESDKKNGIDFMMINLDKPFYLPGETIVG